MQIGQKRKHSEGIKSQDEKINESGSNLRQMIESKNRRKS